MTKRTKIIAIVVFVVIVAVAVYFYFKTPKVEQINPSTVVAPGASNVVNTTPSVIANDEFPLIKGSKGERVKSVQRALNIINPSLKLTVDGDFGNDTYTGIVAYVGTRYYPVTTANFTTIIQKSQSK